MAVQKLITIPDPILYKVSSEITLFNKETRKLARNLFDTMYASKGVGLAAVQIGILRRILVIDLEFAGFYKGVFINPVLLWNSKETQYEEEGCLSVPGLSASLRRPKEIKVAYSTVSGKQKTIFAKNLMARALLHEMDHLDGKIYVDQLESNDKKSIAKELEKLQKGEKVANPITPKYRKQD